MEHLDLEMQFRLTVYLNTIAMLEEGLLDAAIWSALSQYAMRETQHEPQLNAYFAAIATSMGRRAFEQYRLRQQSEH